MSVTTAPDGSTRVTAAINEAVAAEQAIMTAPPGTEPNWAKPAVAIIALTLLVGVIVYAVVTRDHEVMNLCVGAVITMASGAGNYYLGSSSGSDRKTDLLAAAAPIAAAKPKA